MPSDKKILLTSTDNNFFEVEETLAMVSPILKALIQKKKNPASTVEVHFPSVGSLALNKVLEYFHCHASERILVVDDMKTDFFALLSLFDAAHLLDIKSLMDLASETFGNLLRGNTFESNRQLFITTAASSVKRKRGWTEDRPSQNEREFAESRMICYKRLLKLGSGIKILDPPPKVASFLASTIEIKIKRMEKCFVGIEDKKLKELINLCVLLERDRRLGGHDFLIGKVPLLLGILNTCTETIIKRQVTLILTHIRSLEKWSRESREMAVKVMLKLIKSDDAFHEILLALANFASDMFVREHIIRSDIFSIVKKISEQSIDYKMFSSCARFLSVICGGNISLKQAEEALSILKRLIIWDGEHYMPDACIALAHVSATVSHLIDECVLKFLLSTIRCFTSCNPSVAISALEAVGNIAVRGDDSQIQSMVKEDVLKCLQDLLTHEYEVAQKEACQIISNIAARSWIEIEASCKRDLVKSLLKYLEIGCPDGKVDAMWAIFNCVNHDINYKEITWPIRRRSKYLVFERPSSMDWPKQDAFFGLKRRKVVSGVLETGARLACLPPKPWERAAGSSFGPAPVKSV